LEKPVPQLPLPRERETAAGVGARSGLAASYQVS